MVRSTWTTYTIGSSGALSTAIGSNRRRGHVLVGAQQSSALSITLFEA